MNRVMLVDYKYDHDKQNPENYGDLCCELTSFIDGYIKVKKRRYTYFKTYLYNDVNITEKFGIRISFRLPGATRGSIGVQKIDDNQYKITDIHFIEDTCFGDFGCYQKQVVKKSKKFIGDILDFSNVLLKNNDRV